MVQEKTYKWIQARLREIDSGALSESDLERLQEIAKDDPFVADALEGFHAHPNAGHANHFEAIEEKIKIQKRERRRWLVPNLAVTAIAACLLLLIGAYAVIMRMDNAPSETLIVLVEPDSLLNMDTVSGAVAMESSPSNANTKEEKISEPPVARIEPKFSKQTPSIPAKVSSKPAGRSATLSDQPASANENFALDGVSVSKNNIQRISGQIVDAETKKPLAFSPFLVGFSNKLSFTDTNGKFDFEIPEVDFVMNLKHAGYEERTLIVTASEKTLELNLVPSKENEIKTSAADISTHQDENAAAYFAFRNYIAEASQLPLGTGISSNGKKVTILFIVDQTGRPQDIKVGDSTGGKAHVKEALRLIGSGPDWACPGGQGNCRRSYTFWFH